MSSTPSALGYLLLGCGLALASAACGSDAAAGAAPSGGSAGSQAQAGGSSSVLGSGGSAGTAGEAEDLPGPWPSTPQLPTPLTDQSRDLEDILEHGALSASDCDRYFAGDTSRETSLRCGKYMFFYANLEVPGSPAELVDLVRESAPETVGHSLEKLGLFPNPYSDKGLPVGMTEGPPMANGAASYTLTCGSCHFGKTVDGRYAVGSPNHDFSFGKYALTLVSLPELAVLPLKQLSPEVEAAVGPARDEAFADLGTRLSFVGIAASLIGASKMPTPDDAAKQALAILPTGVMDPYSPPSLDDGVKIPVRMSPLWGIDPEAMTAAGSVHGAMLGSNGGAPDLAHIMRTFAFIAGAVRDMPLGKNYDVAKVQPLIDYIMSLVPPKPEQDFEPAKLREGHRVFRDNCYRCHNGPGYAGTQVFDPKMIGTDPNIVHLVDKDDTGKAVADVITPEEITKGLRARRLSAVWSLKRIFHNGSAGSLSDVFCLEGPRAESPLGEGFSTAGHPFTCNLSEADKRAAMYFVESL